MRKCGTCTLCCTILPVEEIKKPALTKCCQQGAFGCRVYESRPMGCKLWMCAYTLGFDLERPDEGGYIVDIMSDEINLSRDGERISIPALVVWVDPARKDAHQSEKLRAYIEATALKLRTPAIVRYGSNEGFVLFPPALTGGEWQARDSVVRPREEVTSYGNLLA